MQPLKYKFSLETPFPIGDTYFYSLYHDKLEQFSSPDKQITIAENMDIDMDYFDISPQHEQFATTKNSYITIYDFKQNKLAEFEGRDALYGKDSTLYYNHENEIFSFSVEHGKKSLFKKTEQSNILNHNITRSRQYLIIEEIFKNCNQCYYINLNIKDSKPEIFFTKIPEVYYQVYHQEEIWYILTNKDSAKNGKIQKMSIDSKTCVDLFEYIPEICIQKIDAFKDFLAIWVRNQDLQYIWIYKNGVITPITNFELTYALRESVNREYNSKYFRYIYQSPVTPLTLMEVDSETINATMIYSEVKHRITKFQLHRIQLPNNKINVSIIKKFDPKNPQNAKPIDNVTLKSFSTSIVNGFPTSIEQINDATYDDNLLENLGDKILAKVHAVIEEPDSIISELKTIKL